jgi:hypothetical protein
MHAIFQVSAVTIPFKIIGKNVMFLYIIYFEREPVIY